MKIKRSELIQLANPVLIHSNENMGCCNNFKGFIQYRYLIENDIIKRSK